MSYRKMGSKIEGSQKLKLKVVDHQNEGTGAWRPPIQVIPIVTLTLRSQGHTDK